MVVNMENQNAKFDGWLWGLAALLLASGIGGQYYFASQSLLIRVIGLLLAAVFAIVMVARTQLGRKAWGFWQESVVELRKVVWPTKQETIHSTLAVLAMVFVMGLVLWSIDAVLVRVMAWVVRQGAV
jgi:preprotein translocase subunit SecE